MGNEQKKNPLICVIDDDGAFRMAVSEMLEHEKFEIISFSSGSEFMEWFGWEPERCDLIISDLNMPGVSGYDLCRFVRSQSQTGRIPIVLITGQDAEEERAFGLEAGADDFIQKPAKKRDLLAKIQSLLSIREHEIEQVKRLTQFISPNVAHLLVAGAHEKMLTPHRGHVTVMFVDLRGFTAFAEFAEPTEVLSVLNQYYQTVGRLSLRYDATIGHMAGDGVMIFLNDPHRMSNHQATAIRLAIDLRTQLTEQRALWRQRGHNIDFGIGLAEGYATIGAMGFDQFWQYSVIGPVANFASRMCHLANNGQILVSHRFLARMGPNDCVVEFVGPTALKGIKKAVAVHNVLSLTRVQSAAS